MSLPNGTNREKPVVSVAPCDTYSFDGVRQAVEAALLPLGGIDRFVRPGMRVLLKPNLLAAADLEKAVTTHPAVVRAVTELVQEAGGVPLIGDSPAGSMEHGPRVYRKGGMIDVAEQTGAQLISFEEVIWKRLNGNDYFIAPPVLEADLVINLPKLKTHSLTLFTGAVKNLFGTIPGTRKRDVHYRALNAQDFSLQLVDVLELVQPGLTIMDGILGQEGNGPGAGGTPRRYRCLLASLDPVALDTVVTHALGYRPGEVLHLADAGARGLGTATLDGIRIQGDRRALQFDQVRLPTTHWYVRLPSWIAAPLHRIARIRPHLTPSACIGCGRCSEVCPRDAITPGRPPQIDLKRCVGCLCCAEICPEGAIEPHRSPLARLFRVGR